MVCCGLRVYGFVCLVVWFACGCSLDGLLCRLFCVTLLRYCAACIVTLVWVVVVMVLYVLFVVGFVDCCVGDLSWLIMILMCKVV